ncbi:MAG: ABC transporter permease [Candidatus Limnocylindria bacterium]
MARRLVSGALVVLFTSAATFFFVNLAPGGPSSINNMSATAEQREALIRAMGLDRPVAERYAAWLGAALHGDLGSSLASDQPVAGLIADRLPNTLTLAGGALLLSCVLGIPMGILQALRRNSWLDHVLSLLSAIGLAIPVFWLGIVLILLFAVSLHVLPSSGLASASGGSIADRLLHLVLPTVALATTILPTVVRFMRSSLLEVLGTEYMRTADGKGLPRGTVLRRHGLPNALMPVLSAVGALIPRLLGGTVVTEAVFGWPGMGRLALDAANGRDYPLVTGIAVVVAAIAVATTVLVDLAYTRLDPRVRLA